MIQNIPSLCRYEKLEAEVSAGAERFQEIMRKWSRAKGRRIPQALHELLQQQKAACDAMIGEKNRLIADFQQELKAKDDEYVKYLKKQAEDVDLLLERLEEQARTLAKAYREELGEIEKAFEMERRGLVEKHKAEWEASMKQRWEKEREFLEAREKRIDENEGQLQHLRVQNAEQFNAVKIKLETDIQVLQQQLQQMKATFQLNAEKLEYNFHVLKKRDEENTVTTSQQKRRITRLQDSLNTLRAKLSRQEKTYHSELVALREEYQKNTEQYRELQKKVKHFQLLDARRFRDIWKMNEERVRSLSDEVLSANTVVHQQQLGLEWELPPPVQSPMARVTAKPDTGMSQATLYASQILSEADSERGPTRERAEPVGERPGSATSSATVVYPPSLVKQVLELLCEEAGFLIESKLAHLLAPLDKDEQMLMKLDSIFKALGIGTEADVHTLVSYFTQWPGTEEQGETEDRVTTATQPTIIHPNDVPQALRQFVEHRQASGKASSVALKGLALGKAATEQLLGGGFWEQMAGSLPESHERVWSALLEGLEQYHSELGSRAQLIQETDSLRQQNVELRILLQQYMHARINQELEIPPTLVVPMHVPIPSTT